MTRIGRSNPPATENPPVALTLLSFERRLDLCRVTPYSCRAVGSTSTWYCLRSPPIDDHLGDPG